jgi:hypothetical protein
MGMTPESQALRQSIRDDLIGAHIDREEFEAAVARVYGLERPDFCQACGCVKFSCRKYTEVKAFRCCNDCSHVFDDEMARP